MCRLRETGVVSQELLVKLQTTQADLSNAQHQVTDKLFPRCHGCPPAMLAHMDAAVGLPCKWCAPHTSVALLLTLLATVFVLDGAPICAQAESELVHDTA